MNKVDLESGFGGIKRDQKKKLGRLRTGSLSFTGAITSDHHDSLYSSEDDEKLKILVNEEASNCLEMNKIIISSSSNSNKKHPKPPRPPMSASLDAASMRQLREMTRIAKLKRARIERMRALRTNKKADKASSSTHHVFAMVVTILFFCIIIFQGILGSRV